MTDPFNVDENDEYEESVRIAVSALDDMRNATTTNAATSSSTTSPSLVARVSHLPLVNSVLRTYEQGKASSRVVKYGAEMMESSVRSISRPVIDRLPVNVNQLDEFACRQLDRFDRYRRSSVTSPPNDKPSNDGSERGRGRSRGRRTTKTLDGSVEENSLVLPNEWQLQPTCGTTSPRIPRWIEATNAHGASYATPQTPHTPHLPPILPDSRSSTPTQVEVDNEDSMNGKLIQRRNENTSIENDTTADAERQNQSVVAQRSRWQAVLLEAGGLSAALSDENMRRLKYCLHCLQYATAQIDAQILILRDFIASLQPLPSHSSHTSPCANSDSPSSSCSSRVSQAHMRTLTDVRRDLVQTIRQVVDVVSKYAGGALPEPARTRVRGFILKLPQRWASRAGVSVNGADSVSVAGGGAGEDGGGGKEKERDSEVTTAASGSGAVRRQNRRAAYRERGPNSDSRTSSRAPSPTSPRVPVPGEQQPASVSAGAAVVAAQRILTLATESLDMMRGVTGVMKDSLERADAWVNRLRTVGIQRDVPPPELAALVTGDAIPEEEEPVETQWHHRRASSNYSATTASTCDDRETSYYSFRSGLTSPATSTISSMSVPSGSGSSTAFSSSTTTPGFAGCPSPSVLPIVPLGRMNLGTQQGKKETQCVECEEGMDVDS